MLFVVSPAARRSQATSEVTRELSLIPKAWSTPEEFGAALRANTRRIVYLQAADLDTPVIDTLEMNRGDQPLGIIVAASRQGLREAGKEAIVHRLGKFTNTEWIEGEDNIDTLRHATRICWQRMLRISQEELRDAISNNEFVIQYQPKVQRVSDSEWKTQEAESLLRWRHPTHGLIGPLEFLPEAEAFGMMGAITERVLEEAAQQLSRWQKKGMTLNSCINLAPSLLRDRDVADRYAEIVAEHGLETGRFTFEVTESDIHSSEAPHLQVLQRFRKRGFRISLDDFGVAASSLSAFEQLPFDEIKIHASALHRAKASPVAQKVLAAVTGLAHNLGISVCAEGVEDQETYEFLKTIQCDKMQGFLISEAVMPDIIRRNYATENVSEVA